MAHDFGYDLDAENGVVFIVFSHKTHEQVYNFFGEGFEGLGRRVRGRKAMKNLEDAVSQLLHVDLVHCLALKHRWLSQNHDEGRYHALEERRICWTGHIVVEAVAQVDRGFDLEPKLCKEALGVSTDSRSTRRMGRVSKRTNFWSAQLPDDIVN